MRTTSRVVRNLAAFALVVLPLFWIASLISLPGFVDHARGRGAAGAVRLVAINVWWHGVRSLPWALAGALLHSLALRAARRRLQGRGLRAFSALAALPLLALPFGWPGFREEGLGWMSATAVLLAAYGWIVADG